MPHLVVRTTSRRPGCCLSSSLPFTPTPTKVFTSLTFEFWLPRWTLSDVCCPTVPVVFFEKQQLDAFVSANGVGGESFCCPPPASFELVSAGTFANSDETPFCKLGYSNSRRLFRPPGPPAARWGGGRRGREEEEGKGRPHIPHPELTSIISYFLFIVTRISVHSFPFPTKILYLLYEPFILVCVFRVWPKLHFPPIRYIITLYKFCYYKEEIEN